jgi:carbon monoxide dehydrogenase subunit G
MRAYEGEVRLEAPMEEVWRLVTQAERVAPCLPDLVEYQVEDPAHFRAKVRVGAGPVRGVFDLSVTVTPQEEGRQASLAVQGSGMGSGLELRSQLTLTPEGPSATRLTWRAEAGLRGPLAALGQRVVDAQARRITTQLFENLQAQVGVQAG